MASLPDPRRSAPPQPATATPAPQVKVVAAASSDKCGVSDHSGAAWRHCCFTGSEWTRIQCHRRATTGSFRWPPLRAQPTLAISAVGSVPKIKPLHRRIRRLRRSSPFSQIARRRLCLRPAVGIHSTIVAAYGSPYHQILTVTVPNGAPAGAKSSECAVRFRNRWRYALLDGPVLRHHHQLVQGSDHQQALLRRRPHHRRCLEDSTHATLTLASGLSSALPANASTQYLINQYLYPPPPSFSPTDPSVLAYAKYAEFLATKFRHQELHGEVEIWNEPPWSDDPWDDRYDFYDIQPIPVVPAL